jgi:hypothetical protein
MRPFFRNCWLVASFPKVLPGTKATERLCCGGRRTSRALTRAPKNREKIRYRINTGDRHAHISPNVVNNALTKLKKLQLIGGRPTAPRVFFGRAKDAVAFYFLRMILSEPKVSAAKIDSDLRGHAPAGAA